MQRSLIMRLLTTFAALVCMSFAFTEIAFASGNWDWTDLSNKIAERQNRPIWAITRAEPYWYLTDGQDLWSGGHLWRTDGAFMADLTQEVRNAGISRIDDLVSDGQTVLFLKSVVARNNNFEVWSYTNGNLINRTATVRAYFASDEGIASIHGQNGSWAFVSTQGRIIVSDANWSFATILTPNQVMQNYNESIYSMTHDTPATEKSSLPAAIVPLGSSSWIYAYRGQDTNRLHIFQYTYPYSKTEITNKFSNLSDLQLLSSNGSSVLLAGNLSSGYGSYGTTAIYAYDSFTARNITASASQAFTAYPWFQGTLVGNDGTAWMFLKGKTIVRFDGSTFQNLGQTNDYFLTLSGNKSGSFLVGGVESNATVGNNPAFPLVAKLTRAQENLSGLGGQTNGGFSNGNTFTSNGGPTMRTSGNPSNFRVTNGGTFAYHVTASDSQGINRIAIYANGAMVKTCYTDVCDFESQYYTNGSSLRSIPFYARATDNYGYVTENSNTPDTLVVDQNYNGSGSSGTGSTSAANGISYWSWFDPNLAVFRRDQTVTFNIGAWSAQGIRRIEIFVDGVSRRTCDLGIAYGNQTCNATVYGGDYASNATISINARVTDGGNQSIWTPIQNLTRDYSGSYYGDTPGNATTWVWSAPEMTQLQPGDSTVFHVTASVRNGGLQRIDIYANGNVIRSCNFSNAYGTQECTATITGNNYSNGTNVLVNAKILDTEGNVTVSNSRNYTIVGGAGTSGQTNTWSSSNPDTTQLGSSDNVTYSVTALDPNGVQRIEIYVNQQLKQVCNFGSYAYGSQTCSLIVRGSEYAIGSSLLVNAKITNGIGTTSWPSISRTYTVTNTNNQNGQTGSWIWSTPETTDLSTNSVVTFHVGANNPNGVQRIDIMVNGYSWNACAFSRAYGNQECSAAINGSSFPIGTIVLVNARITDGNGYVSWSSSRTYHVTSGNGSNDDGQIQSWTWSNPEVRSIRGNDAPTFFVGAYAPSGIRRIEFMVNGQRKNTCDTGSISYGNTVCSIPIRAQDYPVGTEIFVNAKITNGNGNLAWSNSRTYQVVQTPSTPPTFPTDLPGWLQVQSNREKGFPANSTIQFTANGGDADGIDHIDILVNAYLVKTCKNASTCTYIGGPYPKRTTVSYGAKLVDRKGFAVWTGYRTIVKK